MTWEACLVLFVVVVLVVGLARSWATPDLMMLAALTAILVTGGLTGSEMLPGPRDAVAGFGNSGLITIAALFVVVSGLVHTGAMTLVTRPLLGRPKSLGSAQMRLTIPVAALSAFLNNTPVVAMFMPVVEDLCKRTGYSPSKLYLPLSYASICGGICTLIGTSTNLVVNGQMISRAGRPGMGMFEITWIGIPCAVVGLTYILIGSRWLLPDRRPAISLSDDPRQYTVEMVVAPGGALVGQTIEDAGLRNLPGLYLVEIVRESHVLTAVGPKEMLHESDQLVFVGILDSVVDLQRMRGMKPATNQAFKLNAPRTTRSLIEAVVSDRCPVIGKSIREGRFRNRYNAAVIAVARGGTRVTGKIGDIVLRAGDTLLLEAQASFADDMRHASDFFLVSRVENSAPLRHDRAWVALGVLGVMVALATAGVLDMLAASMLAAGFMILLRCCTGPEARRSIDWPVLIVIGAALGVGEAMETSGAAGFIAQHFIGLAGGNPWLVLLFVYLITTAFTELITNNAAAVLVFPIALLASQTLGVDFMPFVITIMVAASASFATPIGYQTNLMVYGPGGYKFSDYLRFGLPLNALFCVTTVSLVPFIWPF